MSNITVLPMRNGVVTGWTHERIEEAAPAAFALRASPDRSERYAPVRTHEVIAAMAERGFVVTDAQQDRATRRDPAYVRHMLRFVHADADTTQTVIPQLLFINSHNGRTKARLVEGLFRFVCLNGLVVGTIGATYEFTHRGSAMDNVDKGLGTIHARAEATLHEIGRMQRTSLSPASVERFAQRALVLRFGEEGAKGYSAEDALQVRREEDDGTQLWRVYNRVQENLFAHALEGRSALGRRVLSRPLTGITSSVGFNRALWTAAMELAA